MPELPSVKPLIRENPFKPPVFPSPMIWTGSAVKMFRKCKRKFFWKYIMRLRPRSGGSAALFLGSAFHDSLAKWYERKRADMSKIAFEQCKGLEQKIFTHGKLYDEEEFDKLQTGLETLTGMLTAYAELYSADRGAWRNVRTEQEFQVDLGSFIFRGKLDLLGKDKDGDFFAEHKTASSIDESYIDRLPLDTQVRGYIYGALFGAHTPIRRVLYNVTRKSKLRRKQSESASEFNQRIKDDYAARPDFYFYREMLMFSKDDIANFQLELNQTHKEYQAIVDSIRDSKDPRSWLPNDTVCNEFFKTCPYHNLCVNGMDASSKLLYEQGETMHEELSDE